MEAKRSDNLCNYYILPLVRLNSASFGGVLNFVNSYLSQDNRYVIVELKEARTDFEKHSAYVADWEEENLMVVFEIPEKYRRDAEKFREGKYSQFSQGAKELIRRGSGLKYREPAGKGQYRTARELLAFEKDETLRKTLESELAVKISKDAELMDIPHEGNFYTLDLTSHVCYDDVEALD
jgi:hypothetical protein